MKEFYFTANGQRWKASADDKNTCSLAAIEYFNEPTVIIYEDTNEVIYASDDKAKDQAAGCDHKKFLNDYQDAIRACIDSIVPLGEINDDQI